MKLSQLKPRIATMQPSIPSIASSSRGGGGSPGVRWTGRKLQAWRGRILDREPLCRHCAAKGQTTVAREVDHIVPLEHGGDYSDGNAQPLCTPCHKIKTAEDRGYKARSPVDRAKPSTHHG